MGDNKRQPTPFLVVPYSTTDSGSRPLAPGIKFYMCPSIHLNGVQYNGVPLSPDNPVNLSVVVDNRGGLAAMVTPRFYWADPSTGFTAATMNLITAVTPLVPFYLPANTKLESSPPQIFVPKDQKDQQQQPVSLPVHFCLFVEVTNVLDPAPGTFDPVNDRHYGQQNLQLLQARAGQKVTIPFFAVGTRQTRTYEIGLRQVPAHDQPNTLIIPQRNLRLVDIRRADSGTDRLRVELEPKQRFAIHAVVAIPEDAPRGSHTELVIEQMTRDSDREIVTGAIGVTIHIND